MRRKDGEEFPFNDLAKSAPSQRNDAGPVSYANTQPKMKPVQLPTNQFASSENREKPADHSNMQNGYFVYPQENRVEEENPLITATNRSVEATQYKQSVSAPKREIDAYEFLSDNREKSAQSGGQTSHKRHTLDRQIQILFCISAVLFMLFLLLVCLLFY